MTTIAAETLIAMMLQYQYGVKNGSGSQFRDSTQLPGGGEGIRTPDPMVANHVLCQLSYTP